MNAKVFKTIFNKDPTQYTDDEKRKMIRIVWNNFYRVQDHPKDGILFLKSDNVYAIMDIVKIRKLYKACFGNGELNFSPNYIYAFYIVGTSLRSIVSTVTIEINDTTATLWNVCNDLKIKKGYMRLLMGATLRYIRKNFRIKTIQLYVLKSNPYYEKAIALYELNGFKEDERFLEEDRIKMTRNEKK